MNATHTIHAKHARALRSWKENMHMAITLVPEKIDATASRKKRGLLDFVGQFAKSLFGVATSQEVAEIAQHAVVAEEHTRTVAKRLVTFGKSLSSLVTLTDQRLKNTIEGIQTNNKNLKTLLTIVHLNSVYISYIRNALVASNHFMELERLSESYLMGVQTLVNGFLPLQLISASRLRPVLN